MSALQWVVLIFESTFVQIALQQMEEERSKDSVVTSPNAHQEGILTSSGSIQRVPSRQRTRTSTNQSNLGSSPELPESGFHQSASTGNFERMRRAVSSSSLNSLCKFPPAAISFLCSHHCVSALFLFSFYRLAYLGLQYNLRQDLAGFNGHGERSARRSCQS